MVVEDKPVAPHHTEKGGSARVALEASVRLVESQKDEERFVGASLALQYAALLAADSSLRSRLLQALGPDFLGRMLTSAAAYRRVGLALVRALVADAHGAEKLCGCVAHLAKVWLVALEAMLSTNDLKPDSAEGREAEAHNEDTKVTEVVPEEEASEAAEALRQFTRLLKTADIVKRLAPHIREPLQVMAQALGSGHIFGPSLASSLSLVQELLATGVGEAKADSQAIECFLESCCVAGTLRGTEERALALGLVAECAEAVAASQTAQVSRHDSRLALGEILGEALAQTKTGDGAPWQACASTLRLAAAGMRCQSLKLLGGVTPQALQRLQALLRLAGGQVRLGLEGHVAPEALCAGCMLIEAAAALLIAEAEVLETAGLLQDTAECLRRLHRIMTDVYDFCIDCAESTGDCDVPVQLPMAARLIAVWQLEDPLRFATEFRRSLPALVRLAPEDFEVLVPSIVDLQDWHLTPGLAKIFEVLSWALKLRDRKSKTGVQHVLQSCLLNLTEIALDAAAYLPEAPLPDAPADAVIESSDICQAGWEVTTAHILLDVPGSSIPRPVLASDPKHPGVKRLQAWSCWLWAQGKVSLTSDSIGLRALAVLCGALLTSVPEEALDAHQSLLDMWSAVAEHVLNDCCRAEEAATWRLSLRLCGFVLDRHRTLAQMLVNVAASHRSERGKWEAPSMFDQISASSEEDADDEWQVIDQSAAQRLRDFLNSTVSGVSVTMTGTRSEYDTIKHCDKGLDSMD